MTSSSGHDAVVIGSGPNGLVAANRLADAGWSVLVLEAQPTYGGAVRSDRELHPDFVHDTFSAFYPLSAASPTVRALDLERHGLVWRHAPAVLGHLLPDGRWATLHRDRGLTAGWMEEQGAGDGERWLELCALWDRIGEPLVSVVTSPMPPVRGGGAMLGALGRLGVEGSLDVVRLLLAPATDLARDFAGPAPGLLLGGNAAHADLALDGPGSGVFGLLLTMLGQTVGFPVPEGGAGALSAALVARLESLGGEVRCDQPVVRVVVEGGRACGVVTADGTRHAARHAVLADVAAPRLLGGRPGDLLAPHEVPAGVARGMRRFRLDPGTVKVDWALSGPVPWSTPPPAVAGTVHVADSLDEATATLAAVGRGIVPARPFLLTGQMTASDPTRSPAGTESMWAYAHVPQPDETRADEGEEGITGRWDASECERFADRMQARVERLAPGFGDRVLARRVMGPHELESRNANLVGGAIGAGTAQLHQELVLRPVPAMKGRTATGVPGLFLASASAHPGPGVHGAPGNAAARAAVWHRRLRRRP